MRLWSSVRRNDNIKNEEAGALDDVRAWRLWQVGVRCVCTAPVWKHRDAHARSFKYKLDCLLLQSSANYNQLSLINVVNGNSFFKRYQCQLQRSAVETQELSLKQAFQNVFVDWFKTADECFYFKHVQQVTHLVRAQYEH